eukprot:XP_011665369.1 PREDICTED: uncharacterized protein LOC105438798 [Strongylocentrotus purpuratus]
MCAEILPDEEKKGKLMEERIIFKLGTLPPGRDERHFQTLDAFCLLEIYAHLKEIVSDHGLQMNMEPWISSKTNEKSKSKTKSKLSMSPKKRPPVDEAVNQPPRAPRISSDKLAVVCDNMLKGLGKHLIWKYGVDVINLDKEDEHEKAVEIAQKDGRAILTTGAPYHMEEEESPMTPIKSATDQAQDVASQPTVVGDPYGYMTSHASNKDRSRTVADLSSEFDSVLVCTDTAFEASGGASQYMNRSPASYTEGALDFSNVKVGKSVDLQVDLVPEGIFAS